MKSPTLLTLPGSLLLALAFLLSGCGSAEEPEGMEHYGARHHQDQAASHDHHDHQQHHAHAHEPPHGGVPLVLGENEFHLELVHLPTEGRMQLFILDGCLEKFVRVSQLEIVFLIEKEGEATSLTFLPQSLRATGEEEGNTSMFSAEADWLSEDPLSFSGVLSSLSIGEKVFSEVAFEYPQGHTIHQH